MTYSELSHDELPERHEPAWDTLNGASSESPFMETSFYLLREATHWMGIISGLKPERPLDRNRAIIRGLVVRLTKLMRLTLRELKDGETFQQLSISRDAIETLGTLAWLVKDDGTGVRFDQYVMNSLIAERELLQDIQKNIKQRDGDTWPIEERMKRSIEKTAHAAGIEDVSKLPGRSKIGYPSAEARVKPLGSSVYASYRMGSVETHGDWNDLFRNHLTYDGSEFSPNLDSLHVRPQNPLMLVQLSIIVIGDGMEAIVDSKTTVKFFRSALKDTFERAQKVTNLHEDMLNSRRASNVKIPNSK